jgi:hypothetical protein
MTGGYHDQTILDFHRHSVDGLTQQWPQAGKRTRMSTKQQEASNKAWAAAQKKGKGSPSAYQEEQARQAKAFKAAVSGAKAPPNERAKQEARTIEAFQAAGRGEKGSMTEHQKEKARQAAVFQKVLNSTPKKRAEASRLLPKPVASKAATTCMVR